MALHRFIPPRDRLRLAATLACLWPVLFLASCELLRPGRLREPLEFFVLSPERTPATPTPYRDPTGAITGYLGAEPGLAIGRIDALIVETRRMPVLSRGRVTGSEPRHFTRFMLHRRDRRRLAAFTEEATGSVMLTRLGDRIVAIQFLTEALTGPEFILSGPESEAISGSTLFDRR